MNGKPNKYFKSISNERKIKFTLNGKSTELETDTSQILLWVLRTELGLTGTKFGCGVGFAVPVPFWSMEAQRSCGMAVKEIEGKKVVTIEGLADGISCILFRKHLSSMRPSSADFVLQVRS